MAMEAHLATMVVLAAGRQVAGALTRPQTALMAVLGEATILLAGRLVALGAAKVAVNKSKQWHAVI